MDISGVAVYFVFDAPPRLKELTFYIDICTRSKKKTLGKYRNVTSNVQADERW